jgi:endo-1,4-beta-xylanase
MRNRKILQPRNTKVHTINSLGIILVIFLSSCSSHSSKNGGVNDSLPSLSGVYSDIFNIGVAVSDHEMDNAKYMKIVDGQFNSVTAENVMKWEFIHPNPGKYDFEAADSFVKYAEANNKQIIGHVLVWHSQTPEWVFKDASGNRVSRDTLLKRMHDHITTVVGRYKGRVDCWDVVNEAIDDNGGERKNIWHDIIGIEYVQKAFEYAQEADSEAVLIYNDYSLPSPVKRDAVIKLVNEIKSKGAKVDVIGMQGHYHLDYPILEELETAIKAFSAIGCKVHFTELDINVLPFPTEQIGADVAMNFKYDKKYNPYPHALSDSMQTVLANRYTDFFEIFIRNKDVIERVTLWGVEDGGSWLNYWPIRGRTNYPLLFDREYQAKPAYWALIELAKKTKEEEN